MPRATKVVVIEAEGRDKGKHFLITEMSSTAAEEFGLRLFFALGQSGVEIPEGIEGTGFAGAITIGIRALSGLPWHLAKPLLDEMFQCVSYIPDPANASIVRGNAAGGIGRMFEEDIEEVSTRLRLREEVIGLHTGFSIADALSKFRTALSTVQDGAGEISGDTSTSPPQLVQ